MGEVKGYKVFNNDWSCRGFQYEVGKTFKMDAEPKCCIVGFHFCEKAANCFDYYSFDPRNKVAEVVALGKISTLDNKSCTNEIRIVREIPWDELLKIVNIGSNNVGYMNTGKRNTGDYNIGSGNTGGHNVGNCNIGFRNTGSDNVGFLNTGVSNTGDFNAGDYNIGDCNTGKCNTGSYNTGDFNAGSYNTGCFNTEEPKIMMFNKPTDMTYIDWLNTYAYELLSDGLFSPTKWTREERMTDEEKEKHPEYKTTGGYLKTLDVTEERREWWDGLLGNEREAIKSLPNFDAEIFEQCTGIKVD